MLQIHIQNYELLGNIFTLMPRGFCDSGTKPRPEIEIDNVARLAGRVTQLRKTRTDLAHLVDRPAMTSTVTTRTGVSTAHRETTGAGTPATSVVKTAGVREVHARVTMTGRTEKYTEGATFPSTVTALPGRSTTWAATDLTLPLVVVAIEDGMATIRSITIKTSTGVSHRLPHLHTHLLMRTNPTTRARPGNKSR